MIWDIINSRPRVLSDEEVVWLKEQKILAVKNNNEEKANNIWCIETIARIWSMYIRAFEILRSKENHEGAWNLYAQIEIAINSLRKHFSVDEKYELLFIESATRKFQQLYPYRMFSSRESIIKETKCSICGKIRSLRNPCGHIKGELYNGEMCYRIITKAKLIAISLVTNPVDKYAVIHIKDQEYSYKLLDSFIDNLASPFDKWDFKIIKVLNPVYRKISRNEKCLCGSGKKYKYCCLKTGDNMMDHYQFLMNQSKINPELIGKKFIL